MLKRFPRISLLSLGAAFAIMSGCDLFGSDKEDDTPTTAKTSVSLNETVSSSFKKLGSKTYTFSADSGYTYSILLSSENSVYETVLNPDSSLATYRSLTAYSEDWEDSLVMPCGKTGTYKVVVSSSYDGNDFEIRLIRTSGYPSWYSAPDAYEVDNTRKSAKFIPSDSTVQSRSILYSTTVDQDIIAVKCDSGKTYTVHTYDENDALYAYILDADSLSVSVVTNSSYSSSLDGYINTRSFGATRSGTYYIRIYSYASLNYKVAVTAKQGLDPALVGDSYEVDNTLKTAKSIKTDSTVQNRTLHYKSNYDYDWIKMDCDSGKTYKISFTGISYSYVNIYNADSAFVSTEYSSSYDYDLDEYTYTRRLPVTKAGAYYIRVYYGSTSSVSYDIAVRDSSGISSALVGDSYEVDNTLKTAKSIKTDSTVQNRSMHYNGTYDYDWIKMDCDSGKTYKISFTGISYSYVSIYNADSTFITTDYTSNSTTPSQYTRRLAVTKAGAYYIRVYYGYSSSLNYNIAVRDSQGLDPALVGDSYETDNTLKTAKAIKTDSTVQSRTFHSSNTDYDWISFAADSAHTYAFYMTSGNSLQFFKSDSTLLTTSYTSIYNSQTSSYVYRYTLPVTKSGTYYVRGNGYGGIKYTIAAVDSVGLPAWAKPDAGEPDKGLATAMAIPLKSDSGIVYRSLAGNDTDWVRIDVKKGSVYNFRVQNLATTSSNSTLMAYLLDSTGKSITYNSYLTYGNSWISSYVSTTNGAVFMRIQPYASSSTSTAPYYVSVVGTALPEDAGESDPNLRSAFSLKSDTSAFARWVGYNDSDWMRIQVDSGRKVTIYTGIPGTAKSYSTVYFRLFSRDSVLIDYNSVSSLGYTSQISYVPRYTGPMYVQTYTSATAAILAPYTIRIENYPIDTVDDNSIATAREARTDSIATSSILGETDVDWYKFDVKAGRVYRIDWSSDYSTTVTFHNADSSTLAASMVSGYATTPAYFIPSKDQTVYMRTLAYSTTTVNAQFRLLVSSTEDDAAEPTNGTVTGALPIKTDSTPVSGRISAGDVDLYSVTLDSNALYSFRMNPTYAGYFSILSADSQVTQLSNATSTATFTATKSGKYLVRVTNYTVDVSNYSLTIQRFEPDSFENDNLLSTAKKLEIGAAAQKRSLLGNDVDWIAVPVEADSTYNLYVNSVNEVYVAVYTDDSLAYGSGSYIYGSTEQLVRSIKMIRKCNVYIKVTPYSTSSVSRYPYTIRVAKLN